MGNLFYSLLISSDVKIWRYLRIYDTKAAFKSYIVKVMSSWYSCLKRNKNTSKNA